MAVVVAEGASASTAVATACSLPHLDNLDTCFLDYQMAVPAGVRRKAAAQILAAAPYRPEAV